MKHLPHKLVHVPALLGHLTWDLIGAHWVVIGLLAEAEVVAQVNERHGDTKPHAQQSQHGCEGNLWESTSRHENSPIHTTNIW